MPGELEVDDLEEVEDDLDEPGLEDDLLDDDAIDADHEDDADVEVADDDALIDPSVPVADDEGGPSLDDEEGDDSDVEASLDVILRERLVVVDIEDDEEEEAGPDGTERGDGVVRIVPKQATEFLCSSCFLVKHRSQLADEVNKVCRDCI
jgi:hypothetical protein